jgi:hypothetical protein
MPELANQPDIRRIFSFFLIFNSLDHLPHQQPPDLDW